MTDRGDIDELLRAADGLPHGPAEVELCERAAALADGRNDDEAGFDARLALVSAANFSGRPDVMLVAYAWLLAKSDADPGRYGWHSYQLLWRYKWVVSAAGEFPQFGRAKCEELLADLDTRFAAAGAGPHAALGVEMGLARDLADLKREAAVHAKFGRARRTFLSDCAACVATADVNYYDDRGQYDRAVAAAGPVLAGRLTCATVPNWTYAALLGPLFAADRLAEAMHCHRAGYRLAARNPADADHHAEHAEFLALTGNTAKAATLMGKHLAGADAAVAPAARLRSLGRYRVVARVLADRGVRGIRLTLPAEHPLSAGRDKVPVAALSDYLDAQTTPLAAAFDARNGNPSWADWLAAADARAGAVKPHPLSDVRRPADGPA